MIYFIVHLRMSYYHFNRKELLQKQKIGFIIAVVNKKLLNIRLKIKKL